MPHHTDPLVALLNIEIAQILIAFNGAVDTLVAQMGGAEVDPLLAKLRIGREQGQKTGSKGIGPAGGFCADDLADRDLHQGKLLGVLCGKFPDQLIQHGGMGVSALGGQLLQLPLAQLQGALIFGYSFLAAHGHTS